MIDPHTHRTWGFFLGSFSSNFVPVTLSAASWHVTVRKNGRDTRAGAAARSWERVASRVAPSTEKPRAAGSCRSMPDGYMADGQARGLQHTARRAGVRAGLVSARCSPWPPAARPAPARELRVHRSNSQWEFGNWHRDIVYPAPDRAPAPAVHRNTLRPYGNKAMQDRRLRRQASTARAGSRRCDRAASRPAFRRPVAPPLPLNPQSSPLLCILKFQLCLKCEGSLTNESKWLQ